MTDWQLIDILKRTTLERRSTANGEIHRWIASWEFERPLGWQRKQILKAYNDLATRGLIQRRFIVGCSVSYSLNELVGYDKRRDYFVPVYDRREER